MSKSETRTRIDVSLRSAGSAVKGSAVIGFKGSQTGFEEFSPRHDDHVEAGRELVLSENLSYQSLSAISYNRPAKFSCRRDSEAADVLLIGQDKKRAVASADSISMLVDPLVIGAAPDSLDFPEPAGRNHNRLIRC
jgi:hypothetical protein